MRLLSLKLLCRKLSEYLRDFLDLPRECGDLTTGKLLRGLPRSKLPQRPLHFLIHHLQIADQLHVAVFQFISVADRAKLVRCEVVSLSFCGRYAHVDRRTLQLRVWTDRHGVPALVHAHWLLLAALMALGLRYAVGKRLYTFSHGGMPPWMTRAASIVLH